MRSLNLIRSSGHISFLNTSLVLFFALTTGCTGKTSDELCKHNLEIIKKGNGDDEMANAVGQLGRMVAESSCAVSALNVALRQNRKACAIAAKEIGRLGKNGEVFIADFLQLRVLDSMSGCEEIDKAIGDLGVKGVDAVVSLIETGTTNQRINALRVAGKSGNLSFLSHVVNALDNNDPQIRYMAANAVLDLNPKDISFLPDLFEKKGDVARKAVVIGVGLGARAVPVMLPLLKSTKDDEIVSFICETLWYLEDGAADAKPLLLKLLNDPDSSKTTKSNVAKVLSRIADSAAPDLVK